MTIDIQKMKQAALEALDNMDDYARMAVGTEPIGALNHLTDFINTVCARLEAAESNQVLSASASQFKQMEDQLTVARENLMDILRKNDSLNEKLEAAEQDAARWKAFVAEAERDYVEVSTSEEPYYQRFECAAAMEEFVDAAMKEKLNESR